MTPLSYLAFGYIPEGNLFIRLNDATFELWDGELLVRTWYVFMEEIQCFYEDPIRRKIPEEIANDMFNKYITKDPEENVFVRIEPWRSE